MADRDVALEGGEVRLVEDLRDEAHVLVDKDFLAVADRDAGRFLAAMLECVEREVGEVSHLFTRGPHAEYATGVLRTLVFSEQIVIQPAVATRHLLGSL